jgi:hypothetical protein
MPGGVAHISIRFPRRLSWDYVLSGKGESRRLLDRRRAAIPPGSRELYMGFGKLRSSAAMSF